MLHVCYNLIKKLRHLVSILNCPWQFCDSQSACTLRALVRYSTDITVCLLTRSFQMDLLKSTLLCNPHFQKIWNDCLAAYLQVKCNICYTFANFIIANFAAMNSKKLCANSSPFLTISLQLTPRCKILPYRILMHLLASQNLVHFILGILLFILNSSTH